MRRLHRMVFNATSAASALLCIATAIFWIRSVQHNGSVGYREGRIEEQTLFFIRVHQSVDLGEDLPSGIFFERFGRAHRYGVVDDVMIYEDGCVASFAGFCFVNRPNYFWLVQVPFWFVVAGASIAPAFWYRRFLRNRRRVSKGLCRSCSYDMRATPTRCPECGRIAAGSPA